MLRRLAAIAFLLASACRCDRDDASSDEGAPSIVAPVEETPPRAEDGPRARKLVVHHAAELSGKDIHFKRAFDSMHAFRKEQLPWWEISDHAYDSFMQSTRGRA